MLNLKTQQKVSFEDVFDNNDENPFSPRFGTHAHHVYIPLVKKDNDSKCALCKNICCLVIAATITVIIVVAVITTQP